MVYKKTLKRLLNTQDYSSASFACRSTLHDLLIYLLTYILHSIELQNRNNKVFRWRLKVSLAASHLQCTYQSTLRDSVILLYRHSFHVVIVKSYCKNCSLCYIVPLLRSVDETAARSADVVTRSWSDESTSCCCWRWSSFRSSPNFTGPRPLAATSARSLADNSESLRRLAARWRVAAARVGSPWTSDNSECLDTSLTDDFVDFDTSVILKGW